MKRVTKLHNKSMYIHRAVVGGGILLRAPRIAGDGGVAVADCPKVMCSLLSTQSISRERAAKTVLHF